MAAAKFWHKVFVRVFDQSTIPMRGKVSRISVIRSGEVSMVVRFGIDEARARGLTPGTLVELQVMQDGKEADS
jgi:hypothetical protein